MRRPDRKAWSTQDELAAAAVEAVEHWGRVMASMWAQKGTKLPPTPRMFTHPDRPAPERKVTTDPAEVRRFFAQHMRGG